LVAAADEPGGVRVRLRDGSGVVRTVAARYLVAADGAHSPVRSLLGVEMREREGAHGGVQVVFRAPLWQLLGTKRYALYVVTTPGAPGVFLPAGRGDRWVYAPSLLPGGESPDAFDPAQLVPLMREGAGVADLDPLIERVSPFFSPGQLADRFRVGRTFLAGDAAHRVTPRGGTGMNIALQSGCDLGWKLAWVLQGWAEPDLLDTYESERRVVAEHNLARSTDPDGSRRPVIDELHVDLGGRLAHAWMPAACGVSTLDILGPGWTLFTGPSRGAWEGARSPSAAPLAIRTLDAVTARAIGVRGDGAVLTRPDGVPVAMWPSAAGRRARCVCSRPGATCERGSR
jgi:2-polyprenyl-6-methoxyphenol hydroxylase-like FAD-dependent oxidoreductase